MRGLWLGWVVVFSPLALGRAQEPARAPSANDPALRIFFIDVEGGAATLVVTPAGESVLFDSGSSGGRDAGRIARAVREAGLKRIDHYVITHWHDDHFGGTEELSGLLPIEHFYDHGRSVETEDFDAKFAWYLRLSEGKRTVLRPGDVLPIRARGGEPPVRFVCLASAGKSIPGKSDGPAPCPGHVRKPPDLSDNAQSLTFLVSAGSFRFLDCGDLTWNLEHELVCPENKIGPVDLFQVTHHGLALSNHPALVGTIRPVVAVINNGAEKGAEAEVLRTLRACPGLEAFFQLHERHGVDSELQAPAGRIANDEAPCQGKNIRVDVDPGGTQFSVFVDGRDGTSSFGCRGRSGRDR